MRDFELPGKSEALGINAMAATSSPQATLAALDVLKAGGNAIDAAITASAVLAVVEPTQTGIGGDCFALIKRRGEPVIALNGSGWAPEAADIDLYANRNSGEIDPAGPDSVTVPGSIRAWAKLAKDHGTFEWERLLTPAVEAASRGYPVTERLARDWERQVDKLRGNRTSSETLLFNGAAPKTGAIVRQPNLAKTLKSIAREGADIFYEGWVSEDIVETLRGLGGVHSLSDFRDYQPFYVDPITASYRGYDIWECPPSGQGVIVLAMAKLLEQFDISNYAPMSAERLHILAEISRIAYAERDLVICDPAHGSVPIEYLLSNERAAKLAALIKLDARLESLDPIPEAPHRDTTYVTVVDQDRTTVSFINSIYADFGSGIVGTNSGVILHNRACGFVLEKGHPNAIAGRKRPMHTIIPALVTRDGETVLSLGVTGAHFQPIGQIQILSNTIDYGMYVQEAIDLPRIFALGDTLDFESPIPSDVIARLSVLGHRPTPAPHPLGTAQVIQIDESGVLRGGADGRRDGIALGI